MPFATLSCNENYVNRRLPPSAGLSRMLGALAFCFVLTAAATNVAAAAPPSQTRAARADEQTVVLKACIGAFVRAQQLAGRSVVVKTETSRQPPVRIGNDYLVALDAVANRSRQWLGGARCVVQPNGTVVSLNGRPVDASDAGTRLADR